MPNSSPTPHETIVAQDNLEHVSLTTVPHNANTVTWRSMLLGLILTVIVAAVNCWIATVHNIHFFGGIQMPFAAIFVLLVLILAINWPLRGLHRFVPGLERFVPLFSPAELLTIYAMTLFGAMISTPGTDNQFMVAGATLFYFQTRENGWANLFYKYIPDWLVPDRAIAPNVINDLYTGGLSFAEIPWHAWTMMLIGWGVFMFLIYGLLFFTALILRRQWIEREALAFPLVILPVQMVDVAKDGERPPAKVFWGNRLMWLGFGIAAFVHIFGGMNALYPDWPVFPVNVFGTARLQFTEQPWSAMGRGGAFDASLYLGAVGVAYLLTREVSFSFWFFFLLINFEKAFAEILGFPAVGLPKDKYGGQPVFLTFQSMGGWAMLAGVLLWTAREHIGRIVKAAFFGLRGDDRQMAEEPFSPRFMVFGFLICAIGLLAWSAFAGINIIYAAAFLGIYLMASLVLARLVVEGGFLFPQLTFSAIEWMTTAMFSTNLIGAASLTKLSLISPTLMSDPRTNVLPAFLHTMKMGDDLKLNRSNLRRLIGASVIAIVVTFVTTMVISLYALYSKGGLSTYNWFTQGAYQNVYDSTAATLKTQPGFEMMRLAWMGVGGAVVFLMTLARSRFLWFPLHPLGYIVATGYPITRLWFGLFLGWLIKTLIMKYGGGSAYTEFRPFMIGLIFGNIAAMVFWMIIGFLTGNPGAYSYWPA